MNWYKSANLLDEIKNFGPNSPVETIDDPRVAYISEKYEIPLDKSFEWLRKKLISEEFKREYFAAEYGWSVPDKKAIKEIQEFIGGDSVLEIGAGYGMWAKLMQDAGISITPTDSFSNRGAFVPLDKSFTNIEDANANKAIGKYRNHNVLMIVWPPYCDPFAANSLKKFTGNKLIFIGEGYKGCTADDEFFDILTNEWSRIKRVDIPRWVCKHDSLELWVRI